MDNSGLSPEKVAEELSLRSVEATVFRFGVETKGVIFAKVVKVSKHPTRNDLLVVELSAGDKGRFQAVTGDAGIREGIYVVFAPAKAEVDGKVVEKRRFGEIVSEGMILSPQDLGMEEHSEEVIKVYEEVREGEDVKETLRLGEKILEIDITPNRGDLLSVRGLARELSALFKLEKVNKQEPCFEDQGELDIDILDGDCLRYRGAIVEGLKVGPSPLNLRVRLWQSGIRSINNVVDITNYILLQEGQPLHAFDLDTLEGGIVVRSAKEGERIKTLDGQERDLKEENLIIADSRKPIAIAGVIGGYDTRVTEETKNVLLESAYFRPSRVRVSSKLLGLSTESSYRFERNVDIERVSGAQDLALQLILKYAGGKVTAVRDLYPRRYEPKRIFMPLGKYMRYAGESYSKEEVKDILERLEIPCEVKRCGVEIEVPSHRAFDLKRDVDLIEEIMRVKGYDHFTSEALSLPTTSSYREDVYLKIREFLASNGLSETISISFEDLTLYEILGLEKPSLEIVNPLVPSQRYMRSSLVPSLLRTVIFNERHYNRDVALFELGKVYTENGEENRLAVAVKGHIRSYPPALWQPEDLLEILVSLLDRLKVDFSLERSSVSFLHPHVQVQIKVGDTSVGFVGKLHPVLQEKLELKGELILGELRLDPLLESSQRVVYNEISRFPPVIRDLALVVDKNLSVSKLLNEIKSQMGDMVEDLAVFDVYTGEKVGEGKKSVGVRLTFRSLERSLTDEEVGRLVEDLIAHLRNRLGAKIR